MCGVPEQGSVDQVNNSNCTPPPKTSIQLQAPTLPPSQGTISSRFQTPHLQVLRKCNRRHLPVMRRLQDFQLPPLSPLRRQPRPPLRRDRPPHARAPLRVDHRQALGEQLLQLRAGGERSWAAPDCLQRTLTEEAVVVGWGCGRGGVACGCLNDRSLEAGEPGKRQLTVGDQNIRKSSIKIDC